MFKLTHTALSFALILGACGGSPSDDKPASIFDESICPFSLHPSQIRAAGPKQTVRCGTLNLLEDRSGGSERRIKVPVLVFKSKYPSEPPIVELAGGPGQSWADLGLETLTASTTADLGSDWIFFEQRGTGLSLPLLSCPELEATSMDNMGMQMDPLLTCRDRLRGYGIDLTAYTTRAMAADVDEMRRTLGYKKIVLSGTSFGTAWGLEVMRQFSDSLDSLILDSVLAPQLPALQHGSSGRNDALTALLTACKSNPACDTRFPDLENTLLQDLATLERTPLHWSLSPGGLFTSSDYVWAIDDLQFYQPELLPFFLQTVHDTIAANKTSLDGADARVQATMMHSGSATSRLAVGMYLSVFCDLNQKVTMEAVQADVAKARPALQPYFRNSKLAMLKTCQEWGVKQVDADVLTALTSSVPTLILSGGLDPRTPPAWATDTAKTLHRASVLKFPGVSHSVQSMDSTIGRQCLSSAFREFFTRGTVTDTACAANVKAAFILQ